TSGELALVILALRACQNSDESVTYFHLVNQLEEKFQKEIENMGVHDGNPLTNYYQLSLDVLTLCLFNGSYSITEVKKYFSPENKNFYFGGQFSVDTGAMAVLALTCVKRSIQNNGEDLQDISHYIESLVKKILSEKKRNGLIGNTYSTGEAMQVSQRLTQEIEDQEFPACKTALKRDFVKMQTLSSPSGHAQILPALMGKTYLDVNNVSSCASGPGHLNISIHEPIPVEPTISSTWISVNYTVQINETFFTKVTVPKGSVFLNVMEEAQKINQTAFRFKYVESSWGPYIISVQGLEENHNDRTYWQLLSGGEPVTQGVGRYVVHNGENLEVRWSKY
uniref:Transcobalamin-like C-terminal domain-containing protein n=1 Tax=Myotis lucifugus TaxID=59463 RepID=G1PHT6_MYOLU